MALVYRMRRLAEKMRFVEAAKVSGQVLLMLFSTFSMSFTVLLSPVICYAQYIVSFSTQLFSDWRMAMLKPNMPNIPGMGAMTDTLEFVKNLWGGMGVPGMNMQGMNVPGMVMPTLSVEEIRKRISDLKAVETWLDLNMNMLRGTIQTLEVQAATIATLQTMGEALNATVSAGAANINPEPARQPAREDAAPAAREEQETSQAAEPTSKDEADAATLTAPLVNAAAWWNMLQSQFQQAVTNAIAAAETSAGMAAGMPTGASAGNGADQSDSAGQGGAGAASPQSAASTTTRRRRPSPK